MSCPGNTPAKTRTERVKRVKHPLFPRGFISLVKSILRRFSSARIRFGQLEASSQKVLEIFWWSPFETSRACAAQAQYWVSSLPLCSHIVPANETFATSLCPSKQTSVFRKSKRDPICEFLKQGKNATGRPASRSSLAKMVIQSESLGNHTKQARTGKWWRCFHIIPVASYFPRKENIPIRRDVIYRVLFQPANVERSMLTCLSHDTTWRVFVHIERRSKALVICTDTLLLQLIYRRCRGRTSYVQYFVKSKYSCHHRQNWILKMMISIFWIHKKMHIEYFSTATTILYTECVAILIKI